MNVPSPPPPSAIVESEEGTMTGPEPLTTLFLREFARRGLPAPQARPDGTFFVALDDWTFTVSLDNLARQFARDQDAERITRFVDVIVASTRPLPPWPEARAGIRFSAERSDNSFGDALRDTVSDSLCRVLSYAAPEETHFTWLAPHVLETWGVSREEVTRIAAGNMAELLRRIPIQVEPIDDHTLGFFSTDSPFKASLIFSPNLREVLTPVLGWPILAVIPCRDFAYLFPQTDHELIPRLGQTVVREFKQSAYPISTEVFRINDTTIEAIGEFPVDPG
jgi:hypothetical protein